MKIYKYLPFSDGSLKVLSEGTIKFNNAEGFNDPFDCIVEYDIDKSVKTYMERKDILEKIALGRGVSLTQLLSNSEELEETIRNIIISGKMHDEIMSKTGISCFSLSPDNILMWSHYAFNHTGFIVEFDITFSNKEIIKKPEYYLGGNEVEYSETMPNRIIGSNDHQMMYRQFLVKSNDWVYEQEYRVLSTNLGPGVHDFDQNLITAVVAGVKMPADSLKVLALETAKLEDRLNKKIHFSQAEMVKGKYELDLKLIK